MSPTRLTDEERLLRSIPEKHLATDVAREAKRWHWLRYHTFRADRSPAGYPDECLVKGQRLVFAELKRHTESPTLPQVEWLDMLSLIGDPVEVYLWRPEDLISGEISRILAIGPSGRDVSRWVVGR